ncbi:hypothetical protein AYI68_g778 [Smittium mucronatum]|uniref:Uncharacterized protein n=1 Tax=Smittium mucronatum TaxID=133383 RepID=A0A1R0H749_9FUNG|nr:hypothetical protein AYI68_g778 [Smittium mucronatum]
MPIRGISQAAKFVVEVKLSLGNYNCTTDLHVLSTTKEDLLILNSPDGTQFILLEWKKKIVTPVSRNKPVVQSETVQKSSTVLGGMKPNFSKLKTIQLSVLLDEFGNILS